MQEGLPESLLAEIGSRANREAALASPTASPTTTTQVAEATEEEIDSRCAKRKREATLASPNRSPTTSPTTTKKIAQVAEATEEDGTRPKFGIGDVVEAEMWEENDCWQTRHRAIVRSFDAKFGIYMCELPAYDEEDHWSSFDESQLHVSRSAEPDRAYNVGDKIHFHWARRRVNGRIVDGHCSEEGVWVLGVITSMCNLDFVVEHYNWAARCGVASRKIERSQLRGAAE